MTDKPWETEPDHLMFMSDAGYVCEIKRHAHFGHLNGYIYIPAEHPDSNKDYMALDDDLHVHGGWTYSDTRQDVTVFGFDCNHAGDYAPRHVQLLNNLNINSDHYPPDTYRTIEYVTEQLEQAARQFKEREKGKSHERKEQSSLVPGAGQGNSHANVESKTH